MSSSQEKSSVPGSVGRDPAAQTIRLLALIVLATVAVIVATGLARQLGGNIPTLSLESDYLIGLIWGTLLTCSIVFWPVSGRERTVIATLWLFRLAVCLIAMLYYEQQYDFLDSYTYFTYSRDVTLQDYEPTLAFGTSNIVYAFSYLWYLLPPSFHALKITCAYVGLIACVIFSRAWRVAVPGKSLAPLWIVGTIPSILFWSSDLGKEPLIFLGIAVATWGTLKLWREPGIIAALMVAAGLVEIFFVRQWMAIIFGAAAAIAFVLRPSSPIMRLVALVLAAAVAVATLLFANDIILILTRQSFLEALESVSSQWATGGSGQEPVTFSSTSDVVAFFPLGAFTALFRPLPGEIGGAFGWLAGGENLVLLTLMAWAALRLLGRRWSFPVILTVALVFCWTSIYAFLSYQNLGTAVRFKLQVLPFLVAIIGFALQGSRAETARAAGGIHD